MAGEIRRRRAEIRSGLFDGEMVDALPTVGPGKNGAPCRDEQGGQYSGYSMHDVIYVLPVS